MRTAASSSSTRAPRRTAAQLPMVAQALLDLRADPHHRVERVFRVLQHHADPAAAQLAPLRAGWRPAGRCPRSSSRSAVTRACGGRSRITARPTVDLPEPLSPTMPSFSRPDAERDAAHGVDEAGAGREGDAQVLDDQHVAVGRAAGRMRREQASACLRAERAQERGVPLGAGEAERRRPARRARGRAPRARRAGRRCACRRRSGARCRASTNTISGRISR